MKFIIVTAILALVALSGARRTPSMKNAMEDIIRNLLESKRDKLKDLFIPSVDLGEFGSATDVSIKNADTFVIEVLQTDSAISINLKNLTVSVQQGTATGSFDLRNVEIPEIGLRLNGVGSVSGAANNILISMRLKNKLNGLQVEVTAIDTFELSVGSIDATIEGIDDLETNQEIINTKLAAFVGQYAPTLVAENQEAILEFLNKFLNE